MPDPETGVPTFAPAYDYGNYGFTEDTAYDIGNVNAGSGQQMSSFSPVAQVEAPAPVQENVSSTPQDYYNMGEGGGSYGMQPRAQPFAQPYSEGQGFQASPNLLYGTPQLPTTISVPQPEAPQAPKIPEDLGLMERLSKVTGMKEETLARLGLGGITALLNAPTIKKAREQSQRGRQDMEALAAPYLQKGAELQRQAQAGELTPVARQQLQASQAQAAQAASARGGVGAQQTAARIEALRSQLLQQQYDYGLKLSGIGDQISLGAIKTGLQADQVVNQMTNNYMNNIVRTLMPQPKYVIAGQPNVTTE
jgi:hypothetical protein